MAQMAATSFPTDLIDDTVAYLTFDTLVVVVELLAGLIGAVVALTITRFLFVPSSGMVDAEVLRRSFDDDEDFSAERYAAEQEAKKNQRKKKGLSDLSRKVKHKMVAAEEKIVAKTSHLMFPETETEVKLKDKLIYTGGVLNVIITAYIVGAMPQHFYLWHSPKMIIYMIIRFFNFRSKHQHYLLFDFCYWANGLTLVYLWFYPGDHRMFQVIFLSANGPLAWSIIAFNNSMVFHSFQHMTSAFIHSSPMLLSYCLRWTANGRGFIICENWPQCDDNSSALAMVWHAHVGFYLWWVVIYYVVVCVLLHSRANRKHNETLFDYLISQPHMKWLTRTSRNIFVQKAVYLLVHFIFATVAMLLATFYWSSHAAHFGFIVVICTCSIWNASGYYFSVFAKRYLEEIQKRVKQRVDEANSDSAQHKAGSSGSLDAKTMEQPPPVITDAVHSQILQESAIAAMQTSPAALGDHTTTPLMMQTSEVSFLRQQTELLLHQASTPNHPKHAKHGKDSQQSSVSGIQRSVTAVFPPAARGKDKKKR